MMTLKDLFNVHWNVMELNITGRNPDGRFIHEWIYGEKIYVSGHMKRRVDEGELTIVEKKINYHHDRKSDGSAEIGWAVKEKELPKALITAPVVHLGFSSKYEGTLIYADVELSELTAMGIPTESSFKWGDKND